MEFASIQFREDTDHRLTLEEVLTQHQWQTAASSTFNRGYSLSSWWLKFSVSPSANAELSNNNFILAVNTAQLGRIDVWVLDPNSQHVLASHAMGTLRPFGQRPITHRHFPVPFSIPEQGVDFVVRVQTLSSTVVPIAVWPKGEFEKYDTINSIIFGMIVGAIILIGLYNLFLYFSTRDSVFFYYVLYVLPWAVTFFLYDGWSIQFLWPSLSHVNLQFITITFLSNMLCSMLFTRAFLKVQEMSRSFSIAFDSTLVICACLLGIAIINPGLVPIALLMLPLYLFMVVISVVAALIALRREVNAPAKYLLTARAMLFAGSVLFLLVLYNILPRNILTENGVRIGVIAEALLLSFALANKINTEKALRLQADKASIEAQAENRAKSSFLAAMSHEIRTPMNGVIGVAYLLENTSLDEKQKQYVQIIKSSGRSLLNIINEILDLSKIDAGKMVLESTDFNLTTLTNDAVSLFTYAAKEKNLALNIDIRPELTPVFVGDPTRLQQILVNLLGNAIKFTHKGSITLQVRSRNELITETDDGTRNQPIDLQFVVRDTGVGIPAERLAHLFEAFTQADDSTTRHYGGTGLGLTICKKLVELMDGEIGVNSKEGQGSDFWFTVPLLPGTPEHLTATTQSDATDGSSLHQNTRRQQSIAAMIVDDNKVNQIVAQGLLSKISVNTKIFSSGQEALQHYQQHHERIDLILMDCEMPGMDGYECTRKIRQFERQHAIKLVPIYALSAHALQEHQEKSLAAGMNGHITKPIDIRSLEQIVHTVERQSPFKNAS